MGALRDGWFQAIGIQEDGALAADQIETGLEAGKFGGELAGGWQTQAEMQENCRLIRRHLGTANNQKPQTNSQGYETAEC
ncbi:MAG: hypothetical protein NTZ40_01740 [Cyanobacteria bacterium]|nr:hypothetical protein [Cyanobacteriota bacterium]